jgi:hypothetical protein
MKLTLNQKYELKSIFQTFLAVFIPLVLSTISELDYTNLSKETLLALVTALLRSAIKASWQIIGSKLI